MLAEDTNYNVYVFANDDELPVNTSDISIIQVKTKDATAPTLTINTANNSTSSNDSEITVNVEINETGTVWAAITENGNAPTVTDIKTANPPSTITAPNSNTIISVINTGSISADTDTPIILTGLQPAETYKIYFYAEDTNSNGFTDAEIQSTFINVTTAANVTNDAVEVTIKGIESTSSPGTITITVEVSEASNAWAEAVLEGSSAPDVTSIKSTGSLHSGQISLSGTGEETITINSGVASNTSYDVYLHIEDGTNSSLTYTSTTLTKLNIDTPS